MVVLSIMRPSTVLTPNESHQADQSANTGPETAYFNYLHHKPPTCKISLHLDTSHDYLLVLSTGWDKTSTHLHTTSRYRLFRRSPDLRSSQGLVQTATPLDNAEVLTCVSLAAELITEEWRVSYGTRIGGRTVKGRPKLLALVVKGLREEMKTAAESAEESRPGFKGSVGVSSVTENDVKEWGNVGWWEVDVDLTEWEFRHQLSLFRGHEAHGAKATGGQKEEVEEE